MNGRAPEDPMSRAPLPPELDAELSQHAEADALRAVWAALPEAPRADARPAATAARDAAWARLQARLADPARPRETDDKAVVLPLRRVPPAEPSASSAPASIGRRRAMFWQVAATAVLAVGLGTSWIIARPVVHAAEPGGPPVAVQLADGSRVEVAPGSAVQVSRRLGDGARWWHADARRVTLRGEAFFDVATDGRPFEVRTEDAVVRVLGTRFDVRHATSSGTTIVVEEGRVAVAPAAGGSAITLGAAEAAVVDAQGARRAAHRTDRRLLNWRDGGFAVVDEPVDAVLELLARRTGREWRLADGLRGDRTISLVYPTLPAADVVVGDLAALQGWTYRRTSRGYLFTPR